MAMIKLEGKTKIEGKTIFETIQQIWILISGFWTDNYVWIDESVWND